MAAIEACPVNITISDCEQDDIPLIYVNPAFSETTGYALEDILGQNCRFLQGADTEQGYIQMLRDAIEEERSIDLELTNYKKDGSPFLNALKMAPVHNDQGHLISFIGIQNDITEQRKNEVTEIERQRLQALGQMAGGVAHQLNNLLQPVISLISLHKKDISSEHIRQDLDIVLESARQAADVVHDVLSFSRTKPSRLVETPVGPLLKKTVEFIKTLLPTSIEIKVSIDENIESISANLDATQFSQVMANLMINASQAMKENGKIFVEMGQNVPDFLTISILDDGPGIPSEIRTKVLEPFFTTRPDDGGTGLGLSVVYGIIKSFGGQFKNY